MKLTLMREMMTMNNYHIEFDYFGDHYAMDAIAFDHGVTYKDCLTIYPRPAFRIVCDLFNISNLKIEPIK